MQIFIDFLRAYPDVAQGIGVVGFMIYITSFFSVQSGRLCGNGILFPVLQVTAATCVLISLASAYNLASFMIQTSYIAIGTFGIALRLRRARSNRKPVVRDATLGVVPPAPHLHGECHQPATFFRHQSDQGDPQKSSALCS